jgi:hypothetical protein
MQIYKKKKKNFLEYFLNWKIKSSLYKYLMPII